MDEIFRCRGSYDGNHLSTEIDFGALTLSRDGRNILLMDKVTETNNGETTISIDVKVDRKYFVIAK
jgi:hypothetical protein